MWINNITLNLTALRELSGAENIELLGLISSKKQELREADGGGDSVPGYSAPEQFSEIPLNVTTLVIKRVWNTEAAATEFANFINATTELISSTVEEVA